MDQTIEFEVSGNEGYVCILQKYSMYKTNHLGASINAMMNTC